MTTPALHTLSARHLAGLVLVLVLVLGCGLAAAQDTPLQHDPGEQAARPGLGSVLREWRQGLRQRLHFRASPEPAAALLQMTQLRLKLEGDAELAVRVIGGLQLTLRSSF